MSRRQVIETAITVGLASETPLGAPAAIPGALPVPTLARAPLMPVDQLPTHMKQPYLKILQLFVNDDVERAMRPVGMEYVYGQFRFLVQELAQWSLQVVAANPEERLRIRAAHTDLKARGLRLADLLETKAKAVEVDSPEVAQQLRSSAKDLSDPVAMVLENELRNLEPFLNRRGIPFDRLNVTQRAMEGLRKTGTWNVLRNELEQLAAPLIFQGQQLCFRVGARFIDSVFDGADVRDTYYSLINHASNFLFLPGTSDFRPRDSFEMRVQGAIRAKAQEVGELLGNLRGRSPVVLNIEQFVLDPRAEVRRAIVSYLTNELVKHYERDLQRQGVPQTELSRLLGRYRFALYRWMSFLSDLDLMQVQTNQLSVVRYSPSRAICQAT